MKILTLALLALPLMGQPAPTPQAIQGKVMGADGVLYPVVNVPPSQDVVTVPKAGAISASQEMMNAFCAQPAFKLQPPCIPAPPVVTVPPSRDSPVGMWTFDGTSYFTAPNLTPSGAFGIHVRIKPVGIGKEMGILATEDPGLIAGLVLFIGGAGNKNIVFRINGGGPGRGIGVIGPTLADSVWTDVLMNYDGSGKAAGIKFTVNGAAASSVVYQDTAPTPASPLSMRVGGEYASGPNLLPFVGSVADIVVR